MKQLIPPALISLCLIFQTYPHVESRVDFRVTNRKLISHILIELRNNIQYITIISSHPSPWNMYDKSHPLFYKCREDCLKEIKKLDLFLDSGYNIGLKLNGSYIQEIIYYNP